MPHQDHTTMWWQGQEDPGALTQSQPLDPKKYTLDTYWHCCTASKWQGPWKHMHSHCPVDVFQLERNTGQAGIFYLRTKVQEHRTWLGNINCFLSLPSTPPTSSAVNAPFKMPGWKNIKSVSNRRVESRALTSGGRGDKGGKAVLSTRRQLTCQCSVLSGSGEEEVEEKFKLHGPVVFSTIVLHLTLLFSIGVGQHGQHPRVHG